MQDKTTPIRPSLGENAISAVLMRHLRLDDGKPLFDEDEPPESWAANDEIEPTLCRVAAMWVSLISTSVDEARVRAVYEIDTFSGSPLDGPTQPRLGDVIVLEIGFEISQTYRVVLTQADTLAGAEGDLGENELLLCLLTMIDIAP